MISALLERFGLGPAPIAANPQLGRRIIIIHNHLFKNAGTTIDWALHKNFRKDFVDHRDNAPMMNEGAVYLTSYLQRNDNVRALSSHHLPLPIPSLPGVEILTLMMFRHPIERVTSVYNFERKQKDVSTPGSLQARKLSLKDYIEWRMRPDAGSTIRNFHTRRALPSTLRTKENFGEQSLKLAKDFINSVQLLGLVERFDESMVLFEHTLKAYYPDIDLSYKAQNISQRLDEDPALRMQRLKDEIGDETYNLLLGKNREDLALYEWVKHEFEKRINLIESFQEKLKSFKYRCVKAL